MKNIASLVLAFATSLATFGSTSVHEYQVTIAESGKTASTATLVAPDGQKVVLKNVTTLPVFVPVSQEAREFNKYDLERGLKLSLQTKEGETHFDICLSDLSGDTQFWGHKYPSLSTSKVTGKFGGDSAVIEIPGSESITKKRFLGFLWITKHTSRTPDRTVTIRTKPIMATS